MAARKVQLLFASAQIPSPGITSSVLPVESTTTMRSPRVEATGRQSKPRLRDRKLRISFSFRSEIRILMGMIRSTGRVSFPDAPSANRRETTGLDTNASLHPDHLETTSSSALHVCREECT